MPFWKWLLSALMLSSALGRQRREKDREQDGKYHFVSVWIHVLRYPEYSMQHWFHLPPHLSHFPPTPSFSKRPGRDSEKGNKDLEWFPGKEQLSKLGLWFGKDFDWKWCDRGL